MFFFLKFFIYLIIDDFIVYAVLCAVHLLLICYLLPAYNPTYMQLLYMYMQISIQYDCNDRLCAVYLMKV